MDSVLEQASYNFPHKLRTYWLGEKLKIDSSEDAGGPGAPDTTPRFRIFTRHTDFRALGVKLIRGKVRQRKTVDISVVFGAG